MFATFFSAVCVSRPFLNTKQSFFPSQLHVQRVVQFTEESVDVRWCVASAREMRIMNVNQILQTILKTAIRLRI